MNQLNDIPQSEVPGVVEQALLAGAIKIKIEKQNDGNYTVMWE